MAYSMHYCPTCTTRRPALGYTCSVCGGPVRLTDLHLRPRSSDQSHSQRSARSAGTNRGTNAA